MGTDKKDELAKLLLTAAEYGDVLPDVDGVAVSDMVVDETAVWEAAKVKFNKLNAVKKRRREQTIAFPTGPVCLVFVGDLHCGGMGVDYPRMEREFALINQMPNTWVILMGDLVDNFVYGRLINLRLNTTFSVDEEWALARKALQLVSPKLLASVGGNHDAWTQLTSGIDYLSVLHRDEVPRVLYDPHQLRVTVTVGAEASWRLKLRHKWKGSSIYNPTHGIERASKFDKGDHFDIAVGGHTHNAAVVRQFVNGNRMGYAIQTNTYKIHDVHAEAQGYAGSNDGIAVPIVLHETGGVSLHSSIEEAARTMALFKIKENEQ